MITTKEQLNEFIQYELKKYRISLLKCRIPVNFAENQTLMKFNIFLRKAEYYHNTGNKLLAKYYKFRKNRYGLKYGMQIPINVFDKGLHIMHVGPVLVNEFAKVGKDCSIHINTGIVAGGLNSLCPVIGDGVVIGLGAVVLGNIKVANYTAIGANSIVNKDVLEENIAVAGIPAKKISNNGCKTWNQF
ncbi:MAG: serine acetyltransferase [Clostridia bacterium]|nr:serine acetyltransferase [Clostridia bacterium]